MTSSSCRLILFASLALAAQGQSLLPSQAISLGDLSAFQNPGANWSVAADVAGDPRHEAGLSATKGSGVAINHPATNASAPLATTWEHGDLELDFDFLLPPSASSGVMLEGRYELLLANAPIAKGDGSDLCGAVVPRWDTTRGAGKESVDGHAPLADASRMSGLWQHLHVEFEAPMFDASGKKTRSARFAKVTLNGFVVQENVIVNGPTHGAAFADEKPAGPLMIRGEGPLALRAINFKRFTAGASLQTEDLSYKFYSLTGGFAGYGSYDDKPVKTEGKATHLAGDIVDETGHFALVYNGTLVVTTGGAYAFAAMGREPLRLQIDGHPVSTLKDGDAGDSSVTLTAGRHSFRLDYIHLQYGHPNMTVMTEGPGLAPQSFTVSTSHDSRPRQLIIEPPADRVRMQRGFVPFDPKKRLYAISVGTPAGVHFAYDCESGALLRVWRGAFLDTFEMWDGRGENQYAKPAGPAITLSGKPVLSLLEQPAFDWPDQPDAMWSFQGYRLESDGLPIFSFKLSSLSATDRIAPTADGRGLTRTLTVSGKPVDWGAWVLLAESDRITAQPGGKGFIVGDRKYYVDMPADSTLAASVRTRNGRQQLVAPVTREVLDKPIVYTMVW